MSTTVSYKGQTLTTVSNDTKTLLTEGKYLEDDLTLTDVSGGSAVLGTKNITANGTYEAEDDSLDGYSEVTVAVPASAVDTGTKSITANGNGQDVVGYAAVDVAVPNSYSAGDEGKVVSNGALVAQTSDTVTQNDTYDTTLINSLTVNVSGGGGSGVSGSFTPTERTGVYTFNAPNCTYLACGLSAPADTSTGLAFTYSFFCYAGHYYSCVSNNSGSGVSGFANASSNPTVSYSNGTFTVNWGGTISNTTRVPQVGATYVWAAW